MSWADAAVWRRWAGLTRAYRLHQHGVVASVYEARPDRVRVGSRERCTREVLVALKQQRR